MTEESNILTDDTAFASSPTNNVAAPLLDEENPEKIKKIKKEKKTIGLVAFITSIIGLVVGLEGAIPLAPFFGIAFSLFALFQVRKYVKKFGETEKFATVAKWLSIAGIVLNVMGIIINIIELIIFVLGAIFGVIGFFGSAILLLGEVVVAFRDIISYFVYFSEVYEEFQEISCIIFTSI